jgi:signal transduction histidine kinase
VDVSKFTDDIARMMTAKLNKLPIEFETVIASSVGSCQIDPGYINAALMNIFENAVDACQRDTNKALHHITFEVHEDKGRIVFSVADDGIGMDEETQAKLFTEFFSAKGRKGTGLGLYVANKIIEQHGGNIEVSSAIGRGSKFRVAVPKQR